MLPQRPHTEGDGLVLPGRGEGVQLVGDLSSLRDGVGKYQVHPVTAEDEISALLLLGMQRRHGRLVHIPHFHKVVNTTCVIGVAALTDTASGQIILRSRYKQRRALTVLVACGCAAVQDCE